MSDFFNQNLLEFRQAFVYRCIGNDCGPQDTRNGSLFRFENYRTIAVLAHFRLSGVETSDSKELILSNGKCARGDGRCAKSAVHADAVP